MKVFKLLCLAVFLSSFGTWATAQIIDFEDGGLIDTGEYVISDGGAPASIGNFLDFPTNVYGWCAENCVGLATITLNRADNQPFTVSSLDAGFLTETTDSNPLIVTGNLSAGGTVVQSLTLSTVPPELATYPLNSFVDIISITFSKEDDEIDDLADAAIDNIDLSPPTPATPVPTLPLFGLGILVSLLGFFGLRKLRA